MRCPKLILASSSPRRINLLMKLGLNFIISPPSYETEVFSDDPIESAYLNALEKARSVARLFLDGLVIAADTIVEIEGKVLGKPSSEDEAKRYLRLLSGKSHKVITAVSILDASTNRQSAEVTITEVKFKELTDEEIEYLVKLDKPLDKAGAYSIQGVASLVIEKIDGDFWNVVGFPLNTFYKMLLRDFGINILKCLKPSVSLL